MWGYSTNVMGPAGLWWYEENNIPYEIKMMNNRWTDFKDVERKVYLKQYYGGRIVLCPFDWSMDNETDEDWSYSFTLAVTI